MRSRRKWLEGRLRLLINRDVHRHFERQKSGKKGTSHIYLLFYPNKTLNILYIHICAILTKINLYFLGFYR